MDTSKLLRQLEDFDHIGRVKRMIELGRQSKEDKSVRLIIDKFSSRSLYEQCLVLETCYGSRDISIAQKALTSSSRQLSKRALILIGQLGNDEEVLDALGKVPNYLQIRTIMRFRDARRQRQRLHVIDTFLEGLEKTNQDPGLFRRLLPLGSRTILDKHLTGLVDRYTMSDWSRLAKYHPDVTQKLLQDWIDRSSEDEDLLVETLVHVLNQWLAHEYHLNSAIALFKAAQKKISMTWLPVRKLIGKRPKELFQMILESEEDLEENILERMESKTLRKLPLAQFLELFKRYPDVIDSWNSPGSFDSLTLEQRKELYKTVNVGWRGEGGIQKRFSLDKLPKENRINEARRHLGSSKFITEPKGKIQYIALLPWDEAIELQAPFLRSSDADIRSSALKHQIAAARFDDSHLSDALQLALACKNEQDPVKREMVEGLTQIPASRWKGHHLDDLEIILRNLLDTSPSGLSTEREQTLREFQLSGYTPVKEIMEIMAQEMSPVLATFLKKKDGHDLNFIASGFDKMIKYWPEFLNICEKVLDDLEMEKHHVAMINILKEHQPRTWSRVIPSSQS